MELIKITLKKLEFFLFKQKGQKRCKNSIFGTSIYNMTVTIRHHVNNLG